jgi:hypothetical protein
LGEDRSRTASIIGLGDVRYGQVENHLHLLSIVSKGTGKFAKVLDDSTVKSTQAKATLNTILKGQNVYWIDDNIEERQSLYKHELFPIAHAKKLYEFVQALYFDVGEIDQISLGGFPLLMTDEVFSAIAKHLRQFGAVAIGNITGTLVHIPPSLAVRYPSYFPKWCLLVSSVSHIKGIEEPEPIVCSAWTVTVDDQWESENKQHTDDKYLQWMCKVGVKDWNFQLEHAVEVIQTVKEKFGATALFEFDYERNWFDPFTPFTPSSMEKLFQNFKAKQFKDLKLP